MDDLQWGFRGAFWFLWGLPLLALLAVSAHARTKKAAAAFAGPKMVARILPPLGPGGRVLKTLLFLGGLALAIVALARPAWDVYYVATKAKGVDVVVAFDVSRSMLADDGGEPRLERARAAVGDLVKDLAGDRVGLLLFAGTVLEACPLTIDRAFFLDTLRRASPGQVGRGGTLIGPALDAAERMLDTGTGRDRVILLVSDAGDQESFPVTAAGRLAAKRIRVITLGIGRTSSEGAPLIVDGQVIRDKKGRPVPAKVNGELLAEIATRTDGLYVPPDATHRLAELYRRYVDPLQKGEEEMQEKHYHERYQWFLLPALLLFLWQAGRSVHRRRSTGKGSAMAAVLLLAFVIPGCGGDDANDAAAASIEALRQGDPKAAIEGFEKARAARPDEPIVDFNLATAHQAAGNEASARDAYARVLDRGRKPLRAAAYLNLALLDLAALTRDVKEDPATIAKERRAEIRDRAEAALDRLQRARDLDPALEAATKNQEIAGLWLRAAEDAWAAKDRADAKAARAEKKGLAFLDALAEEQRAIRASLASGELFQNLALRERDLRDDLGTLDAKTKDNVPPLPEGFADAFAKASADAVAAATRAAEGLAASDVRGIDEALDRAELEQEALVVLWADPARGFELAASRLATAIARGEELRATEDGVARRAALDAFGREVDSGAKRLFGVLAERIGAPKPPSDWVEKALAFAKGEVPAIATGIAELATAKDDPAAALASGRGALLRLQTVAEDWRLAGLEAAPLAETLSRAARDLALAFRGLDLLAAAGASERGFGDRIGDQTRRLDYLEGPLEQAAAPPAGAEGAEVPEAEKQRAEARLAALKALVERAREGFRNAATRFAAGTFPPDPEIASDLRAARLALRDLHAALGGFDASLKSTAAEQAENAGRTAASLQALGERGGSLPPELRTGTLARAVHADEQALTDDAIARLRQWLPEESAAAKSRSEPPPPDPAAGAAGAPSPAGPTPESLEAKSAVLALAKVEILLGRAHEATQRARQKLVEAPDPASGEVYRDLLRKVRPDQIRAAELLAEAVQELDRARLPLGTLGHRIMNAVRPLREPARDLAAGRAEDLSGRKILPGALGLAYVRTAGPFVKALPQALERTLASLDRPGEDGKPPSDEKKAELEQTKAALRSIVARIENGHGLVKDRVKASDGPGIRNALDQIHDAARMLWAASADLKGLLEQGIQEEGEVAARAGAAVRAAATPEADRKASLAADQDLVKALVPRMVAAVEAGASASSGGGDPAAAGAAGGGGHGSGPAGAGLSKELVELAKKNLPLAEEAMGVARGKFGDGLLSDGLPRAEEAKRLLEEILKKLQDDQEKQDSKDQQQQQPPPDTGPMSPEERNRLARAVEERSRKMREEREKQRKPTPVEEDW